MCSDRGRNGFSPHINSSSSVTQFLSRPKVSKRSFMISQKPFSSVCEPLHCRECRVLRLRNGHRRRTGWRGLTTSRRLSTVADACCPTERATRQPHSGEKSSEQSLRIQLHAHQKRTERKGKPSRASAERSLTKVTALFHASHGLQDSGSCFVCSWTLSRDPCGHRLSAECAIVQKRLELCLPPRFRPMDKAFSCPRVNPYTFVESKCLFLRKNIKLMGFADRMSQMNFW